MSTDRSWMYRRIPINGRGINDEFRHGVELFMKNALDYATDSNNLTRCPCMDCKNLEWIEADVVRFHLYKRGFIDGYTKWDLHGGSNEQLDMNQDQHDRDLGGDDEMFDVFEMLNDIASQRQHTQNEYEAGSSRAEQEPNDEASRFYDLLNEAGVPLYEGNTEFTKLSAIMKLLHFKNQFDCSDKGFDVILSLIGKFLPKPNNLPKSFYEAKKMVKGLNLGYEKIDACEADCMLYYGANKDKMHCDICGLSRYKEKSNTKSKTIPRKILRYFPLAPRLQRLFLSSHTASKMRWHKEREVKPGHLSHPADGDEWKGFDERYPSFAEEIRNVRLGLATDGFNPFSNAYAKSYSVWPVIIIVYNLPPSMCMKSPYMFMPLLIPGEKSPTRDINVYLRPLIDELNMLWHTGVETYDKSMKNNFNLKACLLWTINDFPAYGMACGWCPHGKLACPVCMGGVQGTQLKNGGKTTYFGTARQFLPLSDPLRKMRDKFDGTVEKRVAKGRWSGEEVMNYCKNIEFPNPGKAKENKKQRAPGYGKEHNFTHFSIFFELPYWHTLKLRHCIDVMHTEKNVFDNTFYTLLDATGKTKDNKKTRLDLKLLGVRSDLWLRANGTKPRAPYTLKKDQLQQLCQWVSKLELPDGYVSNISRCSKVDQLKFQGFKSHDCHVFMQKLLPIAFCDLLPPDVVEVLSELSNFFKDICSKVLNYDDLDKLEKSIVRTLCKLEMIFPPSYFDSMEHLMLHLPSECKLGGPVDFRWMFPLERLMRLLKIKVKNKACVEGSIAERYTLEELVNFCSLYFESNEKTVHNRLRRHEVAPEKDNDNLLAAYNYPAKPFLRKRERYLSEDEHRIVSNYVLINMPEVAPYINEFEQEIYASRPDFTETDMDSLITTMFKDWFKNKVEGDIERYSMFKELVKDPYTLVTCYDGCVVNGFSFNCDDLDDITSSNSGVMVKGSCYNDVENNYYGRLREVVVLNYRMGYQIVVFKCHWFDTQNHVKVDKRSRLVTLDIKSKLSGDDVFALASQANQVYYSPSVAKPQNTWYTVVSTKVRIFDESTLNPITTPQDEALQEDTSNTSYLNFYIDVNSMFGTNMRRPHEEPEEDGEQEKGDEYVNQHSESLIVSDEEDEDNEENEEEGGEKYDDNYDDDGFENI